MGVTVANQAETCGRKNMKVTVVGGRTVVKEMKNEVAVVVMAVEGSDIIMKNSMKQNVLNVSHTSQSLNRK